jgi:hypothetical protein
MDLFLNQLLWCCPSPHSCKDSKPGCQSPREENDGLGKITNNSNNKPEIE